MIDAVTKDRVPSILIDHYDIKETLQESDGSLVVHAIDRVKRDVAIEVIGPSVAHLQPDALSLKNTQLFAETEVAGRVGFHTNLVPILDFVIDDEGKPCIIREHLVGGTVAERIAHGPLSIPEALRITLDAASGLQAAHETGVVHGDIRPSNIFLTSTGRAKVGNFGCAIIPDSSSSYQRIASDLASSPYASPEQRAFLEPTTDQYSLGLVLFEMINGHAYGNIDAPQASWLVDAMPSPVADIIRRMTQERPDRRYSSMAEVASTIIAAMHKEPSPSAPLQPMPGVPQQSVDAIPGRPAPESAAEIPRASYPRMLQGGERAAEAAGLGVWNSDLDRPPDLHRGGLDVSKAGHGQAIGGRAVPIPIQDAAALLNTDAFDVVDVFPEYVSSEAAQTRPSHLHLVRKVSGTILIILIAVALLLIAINVARFVNL